MRLSTLRLQNFRAYRDVEVSFDDYTCFIGANGAGKSTVLHALNILFRNSAGATTDVVELDREDFRAKDVSEPIVITATFTDLSSEEASELGAYVRQGRLILRACAEWDEVRGKAVVRQFGSRLVMREFAAYFEAEKNRATVTELRELYRGFRETHSDLPGVTTKGDMQNALREYEEGHPELCEVQDSEDQFYGWSRGTNRLSRFIQWVYVPAVKDAATEQAEARNTALGELLQRTLRDRAAFDDALRELHEDTQRRWVEIVEAQQHALADLSSSLAERLRGWSHPGARVELQWDAESQRSVSVAPPVARASIGEHGFVGEVARSGHGMQRAFILSILQELAETHGEHAPTLLLGFEEPELYQHPPQARHLAGVLEELAGKNAQVLVTSHSPYFVSAKGFESIRLVRKSVEGASCRVSQVSHAEVAARLGEAFGYPPASVSTLVAGIEAILQPSLREMFFCALPVLVEGDEDIAYLATHLEITGRWREFRRLGCHFAPVNGKNNLSRPLAIAQGLGIPTFVVFDGDAHDEEKRAEHVRENAGILKLCGQSPASCGAAGTLFGEDVVMWATTIGKEVRREIGGGRWDSAVQSVRHAQSLGSIVKPKNPLLVAATLHALHAQGTKSALLDEVCDRLLRHAERMTSG